MKYFCVKKNTFLSGKKLSLFLIFLFFNIEIQAQGYFNHWYFGDRASIDFNSGAPIVTNNGSLSTLEGSASISDYNGNLLFYTDGITIWNKNHAVMPNGTGLQGGLSATQSALIVRMPADSTKYFIFTVADYDGGDPASTGPLYYSIVDMNLGNGNGDVITSSKNTLLGLNYTEKLVAASSNCGVWVLTHRRHNSEFVAFHVEGNSVSLPIVSDVGSIHINGTGYMAVSPDNQKIASTGIAWKTELYDFDNTTGIVSNPVVLPYPQTPSGISTYGLCFSPNSQRFYMGESNFFMPGVPDTIYQFDLSSNNALTILASKLPVGNLSSFYKWYPMQIGPDNKIYIPKGNTAFLDVIDNPNALGSNCNYLSDAIDLGNNNAKIGLPNALKFPLTPVKFNLGIDTTLCQTDNLPVEFGAGFTTNSYLWSTGSMDSSIYISTSDTYWLEASNGMCSNIDSIVINLEVPPTIDLGEDTVLCMGDILALNGGIAATYLWSTGSMDSSIYISTSGTYWLTAKNGDCSNIDSIMINLEVPPTIDLGEDTVLCIDDILALNGGVAATYLWSTGENTASIDVTTSGVYWLTLNNGACTVSDSVGLSFDDSCYDVQIPNAFTPNGDDFNDLFRAVGLDATEFIRLQVYNRWGQLIFDQTYNSFNPSWGWNGKFKGIEQPIDAYIYVLEYGFPNEDSTSVIKGEVYLAR